MICVYCGHHNKEYDKHCRNCGKKLHKEAPSYEKNKSLLTCARISLAVYMVTYFFTTTLKNTLTIGSINFLLGIRALSEFFVAGGLIVLILSQISSAVVNVDKEEAKSLLIYYIIGLFIVTVFCS